LADVKCLYRRCKPNTERNQRRQPQSTPQQRMIVPALTLEFHRPRQQARGILVVLVNQQNLTKQVAGAVVVAGFEGKTGLLVEGVEIWLVVHRVILPVSCKEGPALFVLQFENPIRRGGVDVGLRVDHNRIDHRRTEQAVVDLAPGFTSIEGNIRAAVRASVEGIGVVGVNDNAVDEQAAEACVRRRPCLAMILAAVNTLTGIGNVDPVAVARVNSEAVSCVHRPGNITAQLPGSPLIARIGTLTIADTVNDLILPEIEPLTI